MKPQIKKKNWGEGGGGERIWTVSQIIPTKSHIYSVKCKAYHLVVAKTLLFNCRGTVSSLNNQQKFSCCSDLVFHFSFFLSQTFPAHRLSGASEPANMDKQRKQMFQS